MTVEMNSIMEIPEQPGWFRVDGVDHGRNRITNAFFPIEALEWRIVEYGLADDDVQTAHKILFSEHLFGLDVDLRSPDLEIQPWSMSAEAARDAKQAAMTKVSARQNDKLAARSLIPQPDRINLYQSLLDKLGGRFGGRSLEHKKLFSHISRSVSDKMTREAHQYALKSFENGEVDTMSAALLAGENELERKIASSQSTGG